MTPQHVLDEALRDVRVLGCCLAVFQDDVIHHSERRHQFRPRTLRQQGPRWIGYFYNQVSIRRAALTEPADVLGQQRVKMAGHPLDRLPFEAPASVLLRDDFRSRVQDS